MLVLMPETTSISWASVPVPVPALDLDLSADPIAVERVGILKKARGPVNPSGPRLALDELVIGKLGLARIVGPPYFPNKAAARFFPLRLHPCVALNPGSPSILV